MAFGGFVRRGGGNGKGAGEPGPAGPEGPQGPPGQGIQVMPAVANYAALVALPPSANQPGDARLTNDVGNWYAWNGSSWDLVGLIRGPQGNPGSDGNPGSPGSPGPAGQGIQVMPSVASLPLPTIGNQPGDARLVNDTGNWYVWSGTTWNLVGMIRGPQGNTGAAGGEGQRGQEGPPGPEGPIGPAGTSVGLKGGVPTPADLPPTGNTIGDGYMVEHTGDLWFYSGTATAFPPAPLGWERAGPIRGPEGQRGPEGPEGQRGLEGPPGPEGPMGPAGTSIQFAGAVHTPAELPPTGNTIGDGYMVEDTGDLWVYSGTATPFPPAPLGWERAGAIRGPEGQRGPEGPEGQRGGEGPEGREGPMGPPGTSIRFTGAVPTPADLPPTGNTIGDGYMVVDTGDLWVYSETTTAFPPAPLGWELAGPIRGPEGQRGPEGPEGQRGPEGPEGQRGLSGLDGLPGPQGNPTQILVNGNVIGTAAGLNLEQSDNVTINGVPNPGQSRIDVFISAIGGGGGPGVTPNFWVDDVLIGSHASLNLRGGTNVTLTPLNNTVAGRVDVTINATGGPGGGENQSPWLSDIDAAGYKLNTVGRVNLLGAATGAPWDNYPPPAIGDGGVATVRDNRNVGGAGGSVLFGAQRGDFAAIKAFHSMDLSGGIYPVGWLSVYVRQTTGIANLERVMTFQPSQPRVEINGNLNVVGNILQNNNPIGGGVTPSFWVKDALVGTRSTVNFKEGANVTISGVDTGSRVDITISATGGTGPGGGDPQSPWLSDILGNDYRLLGAKAVQIVGQGQIGAFFDPTLSDAATLQINDPRGMEGAGGTFAFGAKGIAFFAMHAYNLENPYEPGFIMGPYSVGHMIFETRNDTYSSALTDAMSIQFTGNVGVGPSVYASSSLTVINRPGYEGTFRIVSQNPTNRGVYFLLDNTFFSLGITGNAAGTHSLSQYGTAEKWPLWFTLATGLTNLGYGLQVTGNVNVIGGGQYLLNGNPLPSGGGNLSFLVDGLSRGTRATVNFISGTNVVLDGFDNNTDARVDITINSVGGGDGTGGPPQSPWLSDINAANKQLQNVNAIGISTGLTTPRKALDVMGDVIVSNGGGTQFRITTPNGNFGFIIGLDSQYARFGGTAFGQQVDGGTSGAPIVSIDLSSRGVTFTSPSVSFTDAVFITNYLQVSGSIVASGSVNLTGSGQFQMNGVPIVQGVTPSFYRDGILVGTRHALNLIPGTNVTLTGADDGTRANITINAAGGTGPGGESQSPWLGTINAANNQLWNVNAIGIGTGLVAPRKVLDVMGDVVVTGGNSTQGTQFRITNPASNYGFVIGMDADYAKIGPTAGAQQLNGQTAGTYPAIQVQLSNGSLVFGGTNVTFAGGAGVVGDLNVVGRYLKNNVEIQWTPSFYADGALAGTLNALDLIAGTNVNITGTNNGSRAQITINATAGASTPPTFLADGALAGAYNVLNLRGGANITLTPVNNSLDGRAEIIISGTAAPGGANQSPWESDILGSGYQLLNAGAVGIGTNFPRAPLDVLVPSQDPGGTAAAGGGGFRLATGSIQQSVSMIMGVHDSDYSWIQSIYPGAAMLDLALQPLGGKVGIGIGMVAPRAIVDVRVPSHDPSFGAAGAGALRLATGVVAEAVSLIMGVHDTDYSWIQSTWPSQYHLALALQPLGGNVGVGTTTPGRKLDVWGDIRFGGDLYSYGGVVINGSGEFVSGAGIDTRGECRASNYSVYDSGGTLRGGYNGQVSTPGGGAVNVINGIIVG